MRVAVLGTGIMGAGMARSLLRAGHEVTVWNRSPAKAEALADDGATVAGTAREAVSGARVVLTMLFDADSVLAVMSELAGALDAEAVWLQTSTIGRRGAERIAAFAHSAGLRVLDTPVLGTRKPAEDGALVVLASGDPALRPEVEPVLGAIGGRTVWAGDQVGQASALKLACNAWVASVNAAVAQSIALTQAFGLDPAQFLEAIEGGGTDTPYAHLKGTAMMNGDFGVSFALDGVQKDLGLITAEATAAGVSTSLLQSLQESYRVASEAGHGDDDMAAVFAAFRSPTG